MNIKEIEEFLRLNQIKPSHHRLKIYQYLVQNKNHPSVELIYKELADDIPTLSKTTVYNTLNLFVEKGVAQLITIDESETRYDADMSIHGHFKCKNCGKVYDFQLNFAAIDMRGLQHFQVDENHIYLKGLCYDCQMKKHN
ncbi:peroxide stress regulator [hydrocarbon metagenome]|uniref:Peroxide stress regulator n=1 Tax=hydrocarbon metagenome TaxID=938273 RepID=A0A0W8E7W3_9ZZZZ